MNQQIVNVVEGNALLFPRAHARVQHAQAQRAQAFQRAQAQGHELAPRPQAQAQAQAPAIVMHWPQVPNRCSACHQTGHNRRRCQVWRDQQRPLPQAAANVIAVVAGVVPGVVVPGAAAGGDRDGLQEMINFIEPHSELRGSIIARPRMNEDLVPDRMTTLMHNASSTYEPTRQIAAETINQVLGNVAVFQQQLGTRTGNNAPASTHILGLINALTTIAAGVDAAEQLLELRRNVRTRIIRERAGVSLTKAKIKNIKIVRTMDGDVVDHPTCTICLDDLEPSNIINTNCKHTYCLDCISGYSNSIKEKTCAPTCPMCRGNLTQFDTHSDEVHDGLVNMITAL